MALSGIRIIGPYFPSDGKETLMNRQFICVDLSRYLSSRKLQEIVLSEFFPVSDACGDSGMSQIGKRAYPLINKQKYI